MLPYRIGCVYRFVNNILYRLSEYRLKAISVQHYNEPWISVVVQDQQHSPMNPFFIAIKRSQVLY